MNAREREILLESAASPHREMDRDGRLVPPPAWWDLPPDARDELFELQVMTREMERAVRGGSGTSQAVMARIIDL